MIKTENLRYNYENEDDESVVEVLKGVDLEIHKGQFVAIVGHNGSGKSTLAKHFNAILLPSGGKVYVEGLDTSDESLLFEIRRRVGMVFQNPDNQIVATIVEEDVAFAPENLGVPPKEIRERVDKALKAVGMYERRLDAPHLLSGGQKQRVAIAGILAMNPKYIILDEPTAMLDPIGRREVIDTVRRLNKEENMTVLLITHYMDEAALADRMIVMRDGQVLLDGTPKEVFVRTEELKSTGLDIPQAAELIHELAAAGLPVKRDAITVDECVEEIMKLL
ncbi:MAG TPA: energy-coupling factor transporter ATPase [Candidatus Aphodoplasma excrementigallinarum]|uniref:Energy-coupling factor transporter ATPase n=1 Tax=Candidatus Aphodoplasma excrementigallinarum TaxID=2840673 RepID=A0A9D1SZR0_9FIRM|nr:energy-coupling factor transporter ATPase [Candidatus Aphodoplasma excrementigallinarum]